MIHILCLANENIIMDPIKRGGNSISYLMYWSPFIWNSKPFTCLYIMRSFCNKNQELHIDRAQSKLKMKFYIKSIICLKIFINHIGF